MHDNQLFKKVPVKIQNSSGFDLGHEHLFTTKVGTLTPCANKYLIPGQKVRFNLQNMEVQLPPMATSFFGKVDAKIEAFFVPLRILDVNWKRIVEKTDVGNVPKIPFFSASGLGLAELEGTSAAKVMNSLIGRGTLADYLGFKRDFTTPAITPPASEVKLFNLYKFIAYHKIWSDWYRNPFVQTELEYFFDDSGSNSDYVLPGFENAYSDNFRMDFTLDAEGALEYYPISWNDGVGLFDLRQRNWSKGYFTSVTPKPQYGNDSKVKFDTSGSEGSFSIASLRAANSLQQFCERNNIAAGRYADVILGQFGVLPSDALTDRALYLGSSTTPIYSRSVFDTTGGNPNSRNPLSGEVGSIAGAAAGFNNGAGICEFEAKEHGIFMVLFSLVPRAIYSTGVDRELSYETYVDFPQALLAGIGNQDIKKSELTESAFAADGVLGYTDRYAEAKYIEDKVSGLFADGQSLENFVLQRSFTTPPSLGSQFVSIPTTALDNVTAVADSLSDYGVQVDLFLDFRTVSPLPAYSVPTLEDDSGDVHTIMVDKGGRQL